MENLRFNYRNLISELTFLRLGPGEVVGPVPGVEQRKNKREQNTGEYIDLLSLKNTKLKKKERIE